MPPSVTACLEKNTGRRSKTGVPERNSFLSVSGRQDVGVVCN